MSVALGFLVDADELEADGFAARETVWVRRVGRAHVGVGGCPGAQIDARPIDLDVTHLGLLVAPCELAPHFLFADCGPRPHHLLELDRRQRGAQVLLVGTPVVVRVVERGLESALDRIVLAGR
jgi:hypothetical protein